MRSALFAKLRPVSAALALSLLCTTAAAQDFSKTVFFGDSLSDTGKLKDIVGSVSPQLGTALQASFTTNPDRAWTQVLASSYGHDAAANTHSNPQGSNYAVGGARSSQDVNWGNGIIAPSTANQIQSYLAANHQQADPNALYTVWIGANDLIAAAQLGNQQQALAAINTAAAATAKDVQTLHQAGANTILVPNIPDISLTPRVQAAAAALPHLPTAARTAAALYNANLFTLINQSNANVIHANTFALLQETVANPQAFGFSNTKGVACNMPRQSNPAMYVLSTSLACTPANLVAADANNDYVFADDIHPAGRTHRILAQYYRSLIDSPKDIAKISGYLNQDAAQAHAQLYRRLDTLSSSAYSVWLDADNGNDAHDGKRGNRPALTLGVDTQHDAHHSGAYIAYRSQPYQLSANTQATLRRLGLGVYHKHAFGNASLTLDAGVDKLNVETDRHIDWDGAKRSHQAQADGRRYHAGIRAAYRFEHDAFSLTPYAGVHAHKTELKALAENQANLSTALNFSAQESSSVQGEIGINGSYALNNMASIFGGIGYQHEFKDQDVSVRTSLPSITPYAKGYSLSVATPKANRTHAHLGAKLSFAKADVQLGVNTVRHNGKYQSGGFVSVQAKF